MIQLTRINGKQFYLNDDLIEFMESTPDTVISLVTDKKIIVSESIDEIIEKIVEYNQLGKKLPNRNVIFEREV